MRVSILGFLPALRFLEAAHDDQHEQRGQGADDEHPAPGAGDDGSGGLQAAEKNSDERGGHVADGGGGLQQAEGVGSRASRHHFGDQRDADRELASDAEAGEEAVGRKIPHAGREDAQAGERGVAEDADQHGFHAADAVAQDAEQNASDGPADHENGGRVAGVGGDEAGGIRVARVDVEQFQHRGAAGQREELLVHGVEQPAERGDQKDEPMIAGEFFIPGAGEGIGGSAGLNDGH